MCLSKCLFGTFEDGKVGLSSATFSTIRHSNTFSIEILCISVTFFKLNWEFLL